MKTYGQQTSLFTEEKSICLQEDSHANPIAQQEKGKAKKTSATSGRKCLEQFGRFPRAGLWAKTFAGLLVGMEGWSSRRCRLTWKLQATKFSRFYFLLQASTPRIEEIESGLLPTPVIYDSGATTDLEKLDARRKRMREKHNGKNGTKYSGNGFGLTLGELCQSGLLPTPDASLATGGKLTNKQKVSITGKTVDGKKRQISLSDYINRKLMPIPRASENENRQTKLTPSQMEGKHGLSLAAMASEGLLPTPAARDYRSSHAENSHAYQSRMEHSRGVNLVEYMQRQNDGKSSQLNPLFVGEMMGFPSDWLFSPFQGKEEKDFCPLYNPSDDGERKH